MREDQHDECPECQREAGLFRRDFLSLAGGMAAVSLMEPSVVRAAPAPSADQKAPSAAETKVRELFDTLTSDQKKVLCFPYDHPLRRKVSANWAITEPAIEKLQPAQQDLVEQIVRGLTSEEGYAKFEKQMADDHGGLGSYHIAIFGEPGASRFEFVLTGRHVTMRADGNADGGAAFGGPMVYGHAASGFTEKPTHPGNVFWYQAKRANEVFAALDGKQRARALLGQAPHEDNIAFKKEGYLGLPVGEMSPDQKALVHQVMGDLLSPYRKQDAEEVLAILTANGGLDKIHLAFFQKDEGGKNADLGKDKVWDIWRLEGPGFVWHFRGAPHVHTWVNITRV